MPTHLLSKALDKVESLIDYACRPLLSPLWDYAAERILPGGLDVVPLALVA